MNTGIQILIERMKTNPEEFIKDEWGRMLREYWEHMLPEDQAAYTLAYGAMMQDQFTEVVMKKLAGVGEDDGVALSSKTLPPSVGAIRINHSTNQYEVFSGKSWQVIDPAQQVLRVSTQNNDINQLQNSYQGMQQYGAGGSGGGTMYAGGGGGGGMLSNLAKNLGFK